MLTPITPIHPHAPIQIPDAHPSTPLHPSIPMAPLALPIHPSSPFHAHSTHIPTCHPPPILAHLKDMLMHPQSQEILSGASQHPPVTVAHQCPAEPQLPHPWPNPSCATARAGHPWLLNHLLSAWALPPNQIWSPPTAWAPGRASPR